MTRTARTPRLAALTVSLALAGLLAGCSGDADTPATSTTTLAPPATTVPTEPVELSEDEAGRIARDALGEDATVTSVETGDVEGRPVYRIEVEVDGEQRLLTVDRVNGEVVTNEVIG
jgi:uncharacterized membrane protein YkoI